MKKTVSCLVCALCLCVSMPYGVNAEEQTLKLEGMPVVSEHDYVENSPEDTFITMKRIFLDTTGSIANFVEDEKKLQAIEQKLLDAVQKIAQQGLNAGMNKLEAYSQAFSEGSIIAAKNLSVILAKQDSTAKNPVNGCYILHDPKRMGYVLVQNVEYEEMKPEKSISVMLWEKAPQFKWGSGGASAKSTVGETFTTTGIDHMHDSNTSSDIQWNITIKDGIMVLQTPKAFKESDEFMRAAWNEDFSATDLEPDGVYVFSTAK